MADTTTLTQLSDSLADAVERAGASTVTVNARRRFGASGLIWSADGVIVTADHVVERDEKLTVTLPDGSDLPATIVGRDPGSDIAVLRVAKTGLTPIAHAGEARVGHMALAVGRPGEGGPMASLGVVSAIGGAWRSSRGATIEGYLRSDTTFYPGFSGGPLVNGAGAVLGLNSSRLGRGAGLTIPIAAVSTIVEMILKGGHVKRGYLGIGSQAVRLPAAAVAKVGGQETGLLVVGVEPGSPADTAGLLLGDILVRFGETVLVDTDDLHSALGPASVGKSVAAGILRGGEPKDINVTVGERKAGGS
ncbi:MAG: S1C family serine protease [Dehalococcoidia bacterium]